MRQELEVALEALLPVFDRHRSWKATWLLRIDPTVDQFERQHGLLQPLLRGGHATGWHYHGPLKRLAEFARTARDRGVDVSRIGFGRGSNEVMRTLASSGFRVDSTAMPRPAYPWTRRGVDWTTTPPSPYQPSAADYRVPGHPALSIVEVPISCTAVAAPTDDRQVVRYLDPAYHPPIFRRAVESWLSQHEHLVTITHPYELVPASSRHALLAFDAAAFEENVTAVEHVARSHGGCEFVTLAELARRSSVEVASA